VICRCGGPFGGLPALGSLGNCSENEYTILIYETDFELPMTATSKRANFDLSPEQEELLANLRAQLAASSTKEAVLRAVQLATLLLDEVQQGNRLFVGKSPTTAVRLAIPELEARAHGQWRWLVERPHAWRRQLWVKGRKLLASAVWLDALANGMGPREAAENWDLPLEASEEIFAYCEANEALIDAEANEERQRLKRKNVDVAARAPA
jgi:hypothetical protein